jgi:hypothetical protein
MRNLIKTKYEQPAGHEAVGDERPGREVRVDILHEVGPRPGPLATLGVDLGSFGVTVLFRCGGHGEGASSQAARELLRRVDWTGGLDAWGLGTHRPVRGRPCKLWSAVGSSALGGLNAARPSSCRQATYGSGSGCQDCTSSIRRQYSSKRQAYSGCFRGAQPPLSLCLG